MRSILAVLLENEAGALSRVVGLFAQRNYNIESLTVAPTEDPTLSRLTLTTSGDENKITQIRKQLDKLVEVVRVVDLCESPHVERELLLIKVSAQGDARQEVKRSADIFRGQIVDVTAQTYTIQLVGPSAKLDAFVKAVEDSGVDATILEVVRTGVSGLGRGDHAIPQGGQHAGIGVAHVVEALGEVGYHVGRNPALGDHVVDAGFLGHVLAQQIDHKVHGLNGVQRRATALRTGGGVGGHPRKPELRRFIRERARRARGVVIPGVPMERHINVIKGAGAPSGIGLKLEGGCAGSTTA